MKIIDGKGRLFGKINIIDFIVVALLFIMIPVLYLTHKMLSTHKATQKISVEIPCLFIKVSPEIKKLIALGDKEMDKNGAEIGQITALSDAQPFRYSLNVGDQNTFELQDPVLKKIPVKLKIRGEIFDNKLYYNKQQLVSNKPFIFQTNKYSVVVMPTLTNQDKWIQVKVRFSATLPEITKMLNEGHLEKDKEGRIIGKLKKIISSDSIQVSTLKTDEDKFLILGDANRNEITALLDLLCTEKEGVLYFNNYQIKLGSRIVFTSDIYTIAGIIIGLTTPDK
jgi:hypothetical protein